MKLAIRANRPGARELLARVHLKYLKTSTLVTLLFGTSTTPPILTPGSYDWHKTDGLITFKDTGGQIVYGPLDDLAKLGSQEFSGAAFDECTDTNDPLVWEWLIGRCRREVEGCPGFAGLRRVQPEQPDALPRPAVRDRPAIHGP